MHKSHPRTYSLLFDMCLCCFDPVYSLASGRFWKGFVSGISRVMGWREAGVDGGLFLGLERLSELLHYDPEGLSLLLAVSYA